MSTLRLFDQNSMLRCFDAVVLSCTATEAGAFEIVLDRTAFFPEGGGQGGDQGCLGQIRVLDTQERAGEILHLCDAPLAPGTEVHGELDWDRRWAMMQQHTGEHILSGLIHRMYGLDNVGFHIGREAVTLDFNGPLTEEQLRRAELAANQMVWQDVPVHAWVPMASELEALDYRSKKAIEGALRIVDIPGADTCACCGTHVPTTGCVGQIKLFHWMRYKGGVRLFILCGGRALMEENLLLAQNREAAQLLSAKPEGTAEAVAHLLQERDQLKRRCDELGTALFRQKAAQEQDPLLRLVACDALPNAWLRKAAAELSEGTALGCALIPREQGWQLALCCAQGDARTLAERLFTEFGGKGGGSAQMVQGTLQSGTEPEIRARLRQWLTES